MKYNLIGALICLGIDAGVWIYGGIVYSSKTASFQKFYFITFLIAFIGIIGVAIMSMLFKNYEKSTYRDKTSPSSFKVYSALIGLYLFAIFPVVLLLIQ